MIKPSILLNTPPKKNLIIIIVNIQFYGFDIVNLMLIHRWNCNVCVPFWLDLLYCMWMTLHFSRNRIRTFCSIWRKVNHRWFRRWKARSVVDFNCGDCSSCFFEGDLWCIGSDQGETGFKRWQFIPTQSDPDSSHSELCGDSPNPIQSDPII